MRRFPPRQQAYLATKAAEMAQRPYETFTSTHLPEEQHASQEILATINSRLDWNASSDDIDTALARINNITADICAIQQQLPFYQTPDCTAAKNTLCSLKNTCYAIDYRINSYAIYAITSAMQANASNKQDQERFLQNWWDRCACMLAFNNPYEAELE